MHVNYKSPKWVGNESRSLLNSYHNVLKMASNSRDEILKSIRMGLYGSYLNESGQKVKSERGEKDSSSSIKHKGNERLIGLFIEELEKVNGNARVVKSEGEVNEFLAKFIDERSLKSFSIWDSELIRKLNMKEFLEVRGLELCSSDSKEKLAIADFGITEVDFAISDSGTLVLITSNKRPRSVSLVPPIHLALLKSEVILSNIYELFSVLGKSFIENNELTSCIIFITGPSRTADIELTLTLGVHGPKELYVLILNK